MGAEALMHSMPYETFVSIATKESESNYGELFYFLLLLT